MVSRKTNTTDVSPPTASIMPPFDYSGKTIISIADFDSLVKGEIRRVKELLSKSKWCEKVPKDKVYKDSPVNKLKGVAKITMQKLHKAGFTKCSYVYNMSPAQLVSVTGISQRKMIEFQTDAQNRMIKRNTPRLIDHRKHYNPYFSRYCDKWEQYV